MVTKEEWKERMNNLIERRKSGINNSQPSKAGDYASHLSKVNIGKSVLDVGCGDSSIKKLLPAGVKYTGIDAFPVSEEVINVQIERADEVFEARMFDTVIAFAVLDGVQSLKDAVYMMKEMCNKNIVILTGVDIVPDKYHTFEINEKELMLLMNGFKLTYREEIEPKVVLLEYTRI